MAIEYDHIAHLQVGERAYLLVVGNATPAAAGQVFLADARLAQAPVDEARAVELIRTLAAPHIGGAQLALGGGDKGVEAAAAGAGAGRGTGGGAGGPAIRGGRGAFHRHIVRSCGLGIAGE